MSWAPFEGREAVDYTSWRSVQTDESTWRRSISPSRIRLSPFAPALQGRKIDMLFVNAGVTNSPNETIGEVSTEEFIRVMVTNALGPTRAVEALYDVVTDEGTIGVMSSGQGSVANNTTGERELYRGSKAALNMFMRSFAGAHALLAGQPALQTRGGTCISISLRVPQRCDHFGLSYRRETPPVGQVLGFRPTIAVRATQGSNLRAARPGSGAHHAGAVTQSPRRSHLGVESDLGTQLGVS